MTETEAWWLFFILPMTFLTALLVYLTCCVLDGKWWPWE